MATEERENLYNEARKMNIEDIRKKSNLQEYRSDLEREIYELVLKDKDLEENRKIAKEGLRISRKNAISTRNLVIATWGLVVATFLLFLVTAFTSCNKG